LKLNLYLKFLMSLSMLVIGFVLLLFCIGQINKKFEKPVVVMEPIVITRSAEFTKKRNALIEKRQALKDQLNTIIVSTRESDESKETAIEQINKINAITAKERDVEAEVMELGYPDSFIEVSETVVTINVYGVRHSLNEDATISVLALKAFGDRYDVFVDFHPVTN
jgi:hypothetical protein